MITALDNDGKPTEITIVRGDEDSIAVSARRASDGHTCEYQFGELRADGGLPEIIAAINHARHMGISKFEYKGKLYTRRQARDFGRTNMTEDGLRLWITTPFGHRFFMDAVDCSRGQTEVQR